MLRIETRDHHSKRFERLVLGLLFAAVSALIGHAVLGLLGASRRALPTSLEGLVEPASSQESAAPSSLAERFDDRIQTQSQISREMVRFSSYQQVWFGRRRAGLMEKGRMNFLFEAGVVDAPDSGEDFYSF